MPMATFSHARPSPMRVARLYPRPRTAITTYRRRRRHVHRAGMGVPVLTMTACTRAMDMPSAMPICSYGRAYTLANAHLVSIVRWPRALSRHRRRRVHRAGMGMPVLRLSEAVVLSTGAPIPARRTCRRRRRDAYNGSASAALHRSMRRRRSS